MDGSGSPLAEALDNVVRLENAIKLERQKTDAAVKESKFLEVQGEKKDKELARLTAQLDEVIGETGWTRGVSRHQPRGDPREAENRIGELQIMVQQLEEEQKTNKQIQRKKTQLIESLSKELDGKKQLEEDLYQAQNTIKVKEKEVKELMEKLKTLKRIHARKDKLIISMENEKSDVPIKALEGDKRFLQSEIAKHVEVRRQQERTIRAQQYRIEQLQARLECITSALKELKLDHQVGDALRGPIASREPEETDLTDVNNIVPENEAIDTEVYELLQRDLETLRNALGLKEVIIQEKDSNVEALEKKVEILSHSKRAEQRSITNERRDYAYQIDDLKRALNIQQETYRKQVDKLKQENARLKKKLMQFQE